MNTIRFCNPNRIINESVVNDNHNFKAGDKIYIIFKTIYEYWLPTNNFIIFLSFFVIVKSGRRMIYILDSVK